MPNGFEDVAKRLLDHCLNEWERHAMRFHQESPCVAAGQIRKHIKWYKPLVHLRAVAYFDYWNNLDAAQLWDGLTAWERGEWIVTQLRICVSRAGQIPDAEAYFGIAPGSTYGVLVAELVKDVEPSLIHADVFMEEPA